LSHAPPLAAVDLLAPSKPLLAALTVMAALIDWKSIEYTVGSS